MTATIDKILAEGKKIPFTTSVSPMKLDQPMEMKCYELGPESELEVEYSDGSKKIINAIEFLKTPAVLNPKPNELVFHIRVTKE